jgi:hypothetical protein
VAGPVAAAAVARRRTALSVLADIAPEHEAAAVRTALGITSEGLPG